MAENIWISEKIYKKLNQDARYFHIVSKGETSVSGIFKIVVTNYNDEFKKELGNKFDRIKGILERNKVNLFEGNILSDLLKEEIIIGNDNNDVKLSYNPSSTDYVFQGIYEYVKDELNHQINVSEYIRCLLSDYCSLPTYRREQIIFSEQYNEILKAIKKNKKVKLRYSNDKAYIVSPYSIEHDEEELFNYVLNQSANGLAKKIRLTNIKEAKIEPDKLIEISDNSKIIFEKMKKYGVIYRYPVDGLNETTRVWLNEAGYRRYKRSPVNRPKPVDKEYTYFFNQPDIELEGCTIYKNNENSSYVILNKKKKNKLSAKLDKMAPYKREYTLIFDCSFDQIERYFLPFGEDIQIVEPEKLRNEFKEFYESANRKYCKYYEAVFFDNTKVNELFLKVRGSLPFEKLTKDFHVTTEFMPNICHSEWYGEHVNVEIVAYKKQNIMDDDGNLTSNEGFKVNLKTDNIEFQKYLDSLNHNYHITGSYKDEAKYTEKIDFSDGEKIKYEIEGIFGCEYMNSNIVLN